MINLSYFALQAIPSKGIKAFDLQSAAMLKGTWALSPKYHEYGICIDKVGKLTLGTEKEAAYDYTVGLPPCYINGKRYSVYQDHAKDGASFVGLNAAGDVIPLISSKDDGLTTIQACEILLSLGCIHILRFDGSWSSQGSLGPGLDVDPSQERKARVYLLIFKKGGSNQNMALTKSVREKVVELASADVGLAEPSGDDKFIKWYNEHNGTRFSLNENWCAMAVSYWTTNAGVTKKQLPNYSSCTAEMERAQKDGLWRPRGTYTPKSGDVVIFQMPGSKHTGVVERFSGNMVYTIEGNSGNAVRRKNYSSASSLILGYIEWDGKPKPQSTSKNKINAIQAGLNQKYSAGLSIDSSFGPASKEAMIKAVQTELNRSYGKKLVVDGSWGPASKKACPGIVQGATGGIVWLLQACLNVKGYNIELDGSFGPATNTAVRLFQKSNGLVSDGSAGPATWTKLLSRGVRNEEGQGLAL